MTSFGSGRLGWRSIRKPFAVFAAAVMVTTVLSASTQASSAAPNPYPGAVYAWGSDEFRQLGRGGLMSTFVYDPTAAVGLTGVDALVGFGGGSYAHTAGGWHGWGSGLNGELCNGTTQHNYAPVATGIPATATSVSASVNFYQNSYVLYVDGGTVFGCGSDPAMQDGGYGTGVSSPIQIPGLAAGSFATVTAGMSIRYAIEPDGTVWGWGSNNGQLGDGSSGGLSIPVEVPAFANARQISNSLDHTLALKADGTVLATGRNDQGQLGNNTTEYSRVPVLVQGLTDVTEVAAGLYSSMALKSDGTVWTWGANSSGELGTGGTDGTLIPQQVTGLPPVAHIAASGATAAAVSVTGDVYVWGSNDNSHYLLGNATDDDRSSTPIAIGGLHDATRIVATPNHMAVVRSDGTVASWGNNQAGAIGNGALPPEFPPLTTPGPVLPPADARIVDVEGQYGTAFALTDTGAVLGWGVNHEGMLGSGGRREGTSTPVALPGLESSVTSLASTLVGGTGLAIKNDGSLWAWGWGHSLQLGDGIMGGFRKTPAQVEIDGPVADVAGGYEHVLAAMGDGTVRSWGWNLNGELGNGTTNTPRPTPGPVDGLTDIVAVAAGAGSSYAISSTGQLYSWGANESGQLGDGTTTARIAPQLVSGIANVVSVSGDVGAAAALDANGTVWTWGNLGVGTEEERSAPAAVTLPHPAVSMSARGGHVVALLADGSVWTWGVNDYGQLGLGTTSPYEAPTRVPGLPPVVVAVSAGLMSTYAVAGANPPSRVSIGSAEVREGTSGSQLLTIPVTLDRPAATTVKVAYTTSDGSAIQPSDYQAKTGTVAFSPGQTSQTISIRVYGDIAVEADESFTVRLTGVTTGFALLGQTQATATIRNDDANSTVSIANTQVAEGNGTSPLLVFNVTLSPPATSTIKVTYATADGTATAGSDYVAKTGTVTFLAGETAKTVSVKVNADPIEEPDETFQVTLTGVSAGPGVLGVASALGTIVNDDVTATAAIMDASLTETNSGGRSLVFTVTLSQPVTGAVTLNYTTSDGTAISGQDYVAKTGTVTFAAGVTTKTISISVVGDRAVEPTETFAVTLSSVAQGPATIGWATATATIIDND